MQRKNANNLNNLANYFTKLKATIAKYNIVLKNLQNTDKTNFRVECDKSRIIIILNIKKILKIVDSNNCDYITFVKIVNSINKTILLLLIVKDSQILDK